MMKIASFRRGSSYWNNSLNIFIYVFLFQIILFCSSISIYAEAVGDGSSFGTIGESMPSIEANTDPNVAPSVAVPVKKEPELAKKAASYAPEASNNLVSAEQSSEPVAAPVEVAPSVAAPVKKEPEFAKKGASYAPEASNNLVSAEQSSEPVAAPLEVAPSVAAPVKKEPEFAKKGASYAPEPSSAARLSDDSTNITNIQDDQAATIGNLPEDSIMSESSDIPQMNSTQNESAQTATVDDTTSSSQPENDMTPICAGLAGLAGLMGLYLRTAKPKVE